MNTTMDPKMLEIRIKAAKRFLNQEMTQIKLGGVAPNFTLNEVKTLKDGLHELERVGMRNLTDMHQIKVKRLLTSVEACMKLPSN
jgi:hypothetical protein